MPFWNPFRAAREAAKVDRNELFELMRLQHQAVLDVATGTNLTAGKMAEAAKAQAESFTAYLSLFKVQTPPEVRVVRNEDEYRAERLRDGFPDDASPEAQLNWVLDQTE